MPTLERLLSGFNKEDRKILEYLIAKINSLNWRGLNIKKLKGYQDIFRLRKGKIRIIFIQTNKSIRIINIERRKESTYNL